VLHPAVIPIFVLLNEMHLRVLFVFRRTRFFRIFLEFFFIEKKGFEALKE